MDFEGLFRDLLMSPEKKTADIAAPLSTPTQTTASLPAPPAPKRKKVPLPCAKKTGLSKSEKLYQEIEKTPARRPLPRRPLPPFKPKAEIKPEPSEGDKLNDAGKAEDPMPQDPPQAEGERAEKEPECKKRRIPDVILLQPCFHIDIKI